MHLERPHTLRLQARAPHSREHVVVVTEDPEFWFRLRQEQPELATTWLLAQTAREALLAIEDPHVHAVVLDGAMNDKPANQLVLLLKQIRPSLPIIFAFQSPNDEWEREARQAGVLYYGDRAGVADMVVVVRQCIRSGSRARPRPGDHPRTGTRG